MPNNSNCKGREFCPICENKILHEEFTEHLSQCQKFAKEGSLLKLPEMEVDSKGAVKPYMAFNNHKNKLERPYVVYADMEAPLLKYVDENQIDKSEKVALHRANSVCLYWYVPMTAPKIYYGRM